jgi:hypothetical protein
MNCWPKSRRKGSEAGAALLIAIFALLLISVIAIALLVSTGTDSALASNYRTSTAAYYAAAAGAEEARSRLLWKSADNINIASPNYFPDPTNPTMTLTNVLYIINPVPGENVVPADLSNPQTYPDNEYFTEYGTPITSVNSQTINSVYLAGGGPGPSYKWVRISPATVHSLGVDVAGDGSTNDTISLVYYDPAHVGAGGVIKPGIVKSPVSASGQPLGQVLEITALAVVPPNTQKLLQYVVTPGGSLNMSFPAALTLAGNGVTYTGPDSTQFYIDGIDPITGRTCASPALPPVAAIGYTNSSDLSTVKNGTNLHPDYYWGFGFVAAPPPPATPSVEQVTLPANFQKPSTLETLLQTIRQSADVVLAPVAPATTVPGSALPASAMTTTNPMTVFVDGDLDLTGWHNIGYGLLVVTGNLIYDPDASWEGVVLVIGKGTFAGFHAGIGRIDGAMLVAATRDSSGNVLPDPNLGPSSVTFAANTGGYGIYYNSCMISFALRPTTFKVLSFRERVAP